MKNKKVKIAVLTCGRSDYSVYLPLLKRLKQENNINLHIIAFGSHPYKEYGYTLKYIKEDGFTPKYVIKSLLPGENQKAISASMGLTTLKFADIYSKENYDLLIVLGDRFEMFSAVSASVPFNIPVAHIHGGEKTLGAVDEKFRHLITLMSQYHFVSTDNHAEKVQSLIGKKKDIYNVGALALDNIHQLRLKTKKEILEILKVNFSNPTLLATLHPETINLAVNKRLSQEFIKAIRESNIQTVITLPNNDANNKYMRESLIQMGKTSNKVFVFESIGSVLYYSCMKHCYAVIGNSSSGIVEAASFGKYALNIGDRQKGRDRGRNIIDLPPDSNKIIKTIRKVSKLPELTDKNIYGNGHTAEKIMRYLKHNFKFYL